MHFYRILRVDQSSCHQHALHSQHYRYSCVGLHTIILILFLMSSVNYLNFADVFVLSSSDEMAILLKALHTGAHEGE